MNKLECLLPSLHRCFIIVLIFLFASGLLSLWWLNDLQTYDFKSTNDKLISNRFNQHRLAILVPFRNRFKQLVQFVPHLSRFLNDQHINYHIFILHQIDALRFNRASLINVGYNLTADAGFDYLVMHDIDLLPLNPQLVYFYPGLSSALHISSSGLHPKYSYKRFIGGILILAHQVFAKVNGMSNRYWGWGLEDDEFYFRLKENHIYIQQPVVTRSNKSNTFLHLHDQNDKRDTVRLFNQREISKHRDLDTGLHNLQFQLKNKHQLIVDGFSCTLMNIELHCDRHLSPWCDPPSSNRRSKNIG